jgi:DEAD/DEAH box helicase domain-containing protein
MNLPQILDQLKRDQSFMHNVMAWHVIPPRAAEYAEFPTNLHPALQTAIKSHGIERLYTHQSEAITAILNRNNVVVVTPTASGKTLCYNIPVLDKVIANPEARALYLFPTKALKGEWISTSRHLHLMVIHLHPPARP